jgi:manganese/zinc/iron transport system substrate-binding protein
MIEHRKIYLFLILLMIVICSSCEHKKHFVASHEKIRIVCTTSMIADLVKNIGGDKVLLTSLMGPGVDPHQYKATPGDIRALFEADAIIYHALHLEAKMAELFEKMSKSRTTVAITKNLPRNALIQVNEGMYDPHIWFDVKLWKMLVPEVVVILSKLHPGNSEYFRQNAESYSIKLDSLNEHVHRKAAELDKSKRILITAHDAFGYFGRAYGFQVVGLQGISTDAEAGAMDVSNLVKFILEHKVKAVFIESSVPVKSIKAVQEAVKSYGWNVRIGGELFSDSMGSAGTNEGSYIGMITHNINTVVNALKGY